MLSKQIPNVKSVVLAHVADNYHLDITAMADVTASHQLRDDGYSLPTASFKKIYENDHSYGGFQLIIVYEDGNRHTAPVSPRDAKKYDIELVEPSQVLVEKHVAEVLESVPEHVAEVLESVPEHVAEVEELDDASNEGVVFSKRNASASTVCQPLREHSKAYEVVKMLKEGRKTEAECLRRLYDVGFDEETPYKLKMVIYDLVFKGYQIGKIGKGVDAKYVVRNLDFSRLEGAILAYPTAK